MTPSRAKPMHNACIGFLYLFSILHRCTSDNFFKHILKIRLAGIAKVVADFTKTFVGVF